MKSVSLTNPFRPMRLFFAIRVFFVVLFHPSQSQRIRACLENRLETVVQEKIPEPVQVPKPVGTLRKDKSTPRNEALTLLSTLQRESRLLDLVFESLDQYNDAQIGVASRDVLRDAKKSLDRMFGLKHLVGEDEGSLIEIPSGHSPVRWRILGNDSQAKGTLSHAGWQATKIDMPQWSGGPEDAMVLAAVEVET